MPPYKIVNNNNNNHHLVGRDLAAPIDVDRLFDKGVGNIYESLIGDVIDDDTANYTERVGLFSNLVVYNLDILLLLSLQLRNLLSQIMR